MPLASKTETSRRSAANAAEPPEPEGGLDALCQNALAYATQAKVQQFRYCRRPRRPSSPHGTLSEAIAALETQLEVAQSLPVCQTLAIELLRELAALGHQPPCENERQQKAAALKINTALLELR